MTQLLPHRQPAEGSHDHRSGHRGHRWMMLACCAPMLVITVVLVATGIASPRFLAVAIICTVMMAGMGGNGDQRGR